MISPTLASLLSGRSSPPYSPAIPDLSDFTNPDVPPCPLGWEWCNDMHVWLPADLSPFLDSTRVYRDAAVYPSMRASARPSRKIARVFSPEFWRKAEKRQQRLPWDEEQRGPIRVERADGWVHVHGVTFSQLDLITVPQAQAMGRAVFPPKYNGSTGHPQRARALVAKISRSAGKAPRASTPSGEGVMTPTTSTVHPCAPGHLYFLRPPRLGRAAENLVFPSSVGPSAGQGRGEDLGDRRSSREGLITPGNSAAAAALVPGARRRAQRYGDGRKKAQVGGERSSAGLITPRPPLPTVTQPSSSLIAAQNANEASPQVPRLAPCDGHRKSRGPSEGLITPMTSEPPTDSPLFPERSAARPAHRLGARRPGERE
ncbi:hypothetical protein BKA93DRAFT_926522 [Sparassis latifolia]